MSGWVYQEGTISVAGGSLTTTPTAGMARVACACAPGQAQQQSYVEPARSYAWLFRDRATAPRLVLIPIERFEELEFVPE